MLDRVNQVIYNMLDNKYFDRKFYKYIDTWGDTLPYIACAIRASCHFKLYLKPGQ